MKWCVLIAHVSFSFSWGGGVRGPVFNFLDWTNTSHLKTTKEEGNALPKTFMYTYKHTYTLATAVPSVKTMSSIKTTSVSKILMLK